LQRPGSVNAPKRFKPTQVCRQRTAQGPPVPDRVALDSQGRAIQVDSIADARARLLAQLIGGLRENQPLPEREQDNVGITFEVERSHDVILVEHHCLFADIKNAANLFHGPALREQL
jgi:hypothetical protein